MNTPDELRNVESMLGSLVPTGTVSRDRVMFDAGRAAARRAARPWQAMTGLLAIVTVAVISLPPTQPPVAGVVSGSADRPRLTSPVTTGVEPADGLRPQPPEYSGNGTLAYVELRRRVLEHGLDALPTSPTGPAENPLLHPLDRRQLQRLLENTL